MKNKQVHLYMILYITCSYKLHYWLQPPNVRTKCIQNRIEGNPYLLLEPSKRALISCVVGLGVIGIWVINHPVHPLYQHSQGEVVK